MIFMIKWRIPFFICSFTAVLLLAGVALRSDSAPRERRILYYHDPMHPDYRSDQPGIAPDCGMKLEPVYAKDDPPAGKPPGAGVVRVSKEKELALGVRTEVVSAAPVSESIRLLARIVPDETRSFVVNAPVDCWIINGGSATTGSYVRKGEKLGSFYTADFLTPQQTFILSAASGEREAAAAAARPDSERPSIREMSTNQRKVPMSGIQSVNSERYADILRNIGMDQTQIDDVARTRQPAHEIFVYSPADAVVLTRNITAGQRFERGHEWFRLADLSRVWVVADVFENDARVLADVKHAALHYQGMTVPIHMSGVAPFFDSETRALKLRFDVANPGNALRPGMFAEVELEIAHAPAISVPAEAVSNYGARKVVFVQSSPGTFEPKVIETGQRFGERIVVSHGLKTGERIVVSGNFLIDSESRFTSQVGDTAGRQSR